MKNLREFSVLPLQLFSKSKVISKQKELKKYLGGRLGLIYVYEFYSDITIRLDFTL